jgi:glycosyltransferase involved in cell wall biosynthesis
MRLLIATDFNPGSPGGGPTVVCQMLKGFRKEGHQIYWWSCRYPNPNDELFPVDGHKFAPIHPRLMPAKRVTRLKALLLYYGWVHFASHSLKTAIKLFKPHHIWTIPHDWSILPIHNVLVKNSKFRIPFHTTIQDYPDVHGNASRWGVSIARNIVEKQLDIYRSASSNDATSRPMLDDLYHITGKRGFQMIHEGLEKKDFERIKGIKNKKHNQQIRLAFAGTILAEPEFETFIAGLKLARAKESKLCLEFWSGFSYKSKSWFDSSWMKEHGNVNRDRMVDQISDCDWGVITMPFDRDSLRYSQYSFPTKFISYLAAGIPPIILGRKDSAVMKMADQFDLGLRLVSHDAKTIAVNLNETIWQENTSEKYNQRIIDCSHRYFDANVMRKNLWACFGMSGEIQ